MVVPPELQGTPWGDWLAAAPGVLVDAQGNAYHQRATTWLEQCPGQRSALTALQIAVLTIRLKEYRSDLLEARNDPPSTGVDRLLFAILSLIGTVTTLAIAVGPTLMGVIPAAVLVPATIALVTIGYALLDCSRKLTKRARYGMINAIAKRVRSTYESELVLVGSLSAPDPMPAPSLPAGVQVPVVPMKLPPQ